MRDDIVGQKLSQIEGVSQVIISGAEKSAVRVQINPAALASTGLSLEDVRTFLGQVNVDHPKGSVDGDQASYAIDSNDQLFDAERLSGPRSSRKNNGIPIKLSSPGQGRRGRGEQPAGRLGRARNRAVLVIIFKQADANVIETVDRIKAALPATGTWMPPAINISSPQRPHHHHPRLGR